MAKESMKAREVKRAKLVARYAAKRKALKEAGDYAGLAKLPKNSNPIRLHNRCQITGRPKGYMRQFGISRIQFREMASAGLLPGVKKASWESAEWGRAVIDSALPTMIKIRETSRSIREVSRFFLFSGRCISRRL